MAKFSFSIIDQDGGELRCSPMPAMPADSQWMQDLINETFLEKIIKDAGDNEDGETGMSRCIDYYCKEQGIPLEIGEQAYQHWARREALAAGIPLSVIEGKTKLTDHFSKEYIDSRCAPGEWDRANMVYPDDPATRVI